MGYITGMCNSFDEMKSAFVNLCLAAGYSQTTDSNNKTVIYKASEGLYIMVEVGALNKTPQVPDCLRILGRTNINEGDAPTKVGMGDIYKYLTAESPGPVVFPVIYHGFYYSNVNEVYFIIQYNQMYQFIAFGKSTVTLPGTGLWVAGSISPHSDTYYSSDIDRSRPCALHISITGNMGSFNAYGGFIPALFWLGVRRMISTTYPYSDRNCWVHSNIDTNYPWSLSSSDYNQHRAGVGYLSLYLQAQPQQFNREALLLPILAYKPSHLYSGYYHLVASLVNARHMKINYIDPETIINKDGDQWMVFPCFKKVYKSEYWTTSGNSYATDTGNFGWAVKKEA